MPGIGPVACMDNPPITVEILQAQLEVLFVLCDVLVRENFVEIEREWDVDLICELFHQESVLIEPESTESTTKSLTC